MIFLSPQSMVLAVFALNLLPLSAFAFVQPSSSPPPQGIYSQCYAQPSASASASALQATKVGFLGCGVIASAIATGIATQTEVPIDSIKVTKRSEAKSSTLKKAFPDLISVHEDNQEIVDQSDVIFVCVLPEQTSKVLQSLKFDSKKQELISLVVSQCKV